MRLALVCIFEPHTAEHNLMAGRHGAARVLGHESKLYTVPFKHGPTAPPRPLPLIAAEALRLCLSMALWRPHVVLVQKLLPPTLLYVLFCRLFGLRTVAIADDWEGVGGFTTLRRRSWLGHMIVTACEELIPRLATNTWAVSLPLARRWPNAIYEPNGGALPGNAPACDKATVYTVCYVGTLKDPEVVQMLAEIARATADLALHLVIVGGGPLEEALAGRVHGNRNVSMLGQLPPDEAAAVMLQSHVGLLYLTHDSMMVDVSRSSTKLFEYMAAGCVPISSAVGEPIGIIDHERTGLLVSNTPEAFTRAIVRLQREAGLRERMAEAAQDTFHRRYHHTAIMDRVLRRVTGC